MARKRERRRVRAVSHGSTLRLKVCLGYALQLRDCFEQYIYTGIVAHGSSSLDLRRDEDTFGRASPLVIAVTENCVLRIADCDLSRVLCAVAAGPPKLEDAKGLGGRARKGAGLGMQRSVTANSNGSFREGSLTSRISASGPGAAVPG